DVARLVGNLVFLFCFGNAVNARLGHVLFLGLYALLGALSGLVELYLGPGKAVQGAAGAVMGITGVFVVLYPRNDVRVVFWLGGGWRGTFAVAAYWVVFVCLLADLLGTAFGDGGTVYVGHLAGLAAGALVALALLLTGLVKLRAGEENLLQ